MFHCNESLTNCMRRRKLHAYREDFNDASLLTSKADKLYEEVESIDVLLIELEG